MSSAGRAASLSGCVGRPRGHETGLTATPSKSNTLRPLAALSWKRPNIGSRMNREVHVRIWERPAVRILRATRHQDQFVPTRPSVGCAFDQETFAGMPATGKKRRVRTFPSAPPNEKVHTLRSPSQWNVHGREQEAS